MKQAPGLTAVLVTLALGLGATALGVHTGRDLVTFLLVGEPRTAVVVQTSKAARGTGSSNLVSEGALFAFQQDGARVERWSYLTSGDYRYDIGETVEVLVLPGHASVHPAGDMKALAFPAVFTAAGLGLLAMGIGAWRRRA